MMIASGDTQRETHGSPWFARTAKHGARQWLLCLPHAGAGATVYASWEKLLPPDIGLRAVHLPGREMRIHERPYRDARALARELLPSVASIADRPVILFGHSVGAIVAFELACAMRRAGLPAPAHLYISGRGAPHLPLRPRATWDLTDEGLVDFLRRLGGTPAVVLDDPDLLRMFLPVLRADLEMNERYDVTDEAPLDVPITAFAATADERAPHEDVTQWASNTARRFTVMQIDGGHFAVMANPQVVIDRVVDDAEAREQSS
jgi:surfactin synthase thioesterase subunit